MSQRERYILVYADWQELDNPKLMGRLSAIQMRGKEIFAFEYDKEWLNTNYVQIDPDLYFFNGRQFLNDNKPNFGIFMDSSPDRWGRLLMRRREAALARQEQRKESLLFETDYLLGVFDEHRMGALRFKIEGNNTFLSDNQAMAAPPFTSLRELEQASLKLEQENSLNDSEYLKWLNMLMAPGSSLGGARPKASVLDPNQELWIAKFPSKFDDKNIGAWEMVVHDLSKQAGIDVADAFIQKFNSRHHTFVTKRFDRIGKQRIHFASAMTLLGYTDGADYQEGVSYLHLAEFIMQHGINIDKDLEELWRRIVFSICVSNTDDHLRNHGFLLTSKGWKLSPAYDINPNESGTGLKLNISENDNALDLDLALSVAPFFRIKFERANNIIEEIKKATSTWRKLATKYKIGKNEQELMNRAFIQY
jgi:serine/threonine-protein kinase HipA